MTSTLPGARPAPDQGEAGAGATSGAGSGANLVMLQEATALTLRSPHHLQFGTVPGQSLVLGVPDGVAASQVMLVLREAMRPVQTADLVARLGYCGLTVEHAAGIIADLENAGLLRRLPTPSAEVTVTGTAVLSAAVLRNLLRSGVSATSVTPGSPAFGRLGPGSPVVLAGHLFPPQDVTHRLMAQGVPHLPCGVVDGTVAVGPLVRPGDTPCLVCIDTQLLAQDPDWRHIRAQSAGGGTGATTSTTELAGALTAGILRDALGSGVPLHERTPDGLGARRFLDPVTLDVTRHRMVSVPGCRGCAAYSNVHQRPQRTQR